MILISKPESSPALVPCAGTYFAEQLGLGSPCVRLIRQVDPGTFDIIENSDLPMDVYIDEIEILSLPSRGSKLRNVGNFNPAD